MTTTDQIRQARLELNRARQDLAHATNALAAATGKVLDLDLRALDEKAAEKVASKLGVYDSGGQLLGEMHVRDGVADPEGDSIVIPRSNLPEVVPVDRHGTVDVDDRLMDIECDTAEQNRAHARRFLALAEHLDARPLTEAPAPDLPTKPGALIRATGMTNKGSFEDAVLFRDHNGCWRGDVSSGFMAFVRANDRIDTFTILATHDPATQAVVPRAALDALRDAFTCKPGNDEDFVSDLAGDLIVATDALNEGDQS